MTAAVRQALRRAVAESSPRLVEAMFLCEVSAASDALSGSSPQSCLTLVAGTVIVLIRSWHDTLASSEISSTAQGCGGTQVCTQCWGGGGRAL